MSYKKNYQSISKRAPRMLHRAENDETSEAVLSWMMTLNMSQSQLGDRETPSNACTIIAINVADLCHRVAAAEASKDAEKTNSKKKTSEEGKPTNKEKNRDIFTIPEAIHEIQRCYHRQNHEIDYALPHFAHMNTLLHRHCRQASRLHRFSTRDERSSALRLAQSWRGDCVCLDESTQQPRSMDDEKDLPGIAEEIGGKASCVQVLGPSEKNDAPNVVYWLKVTARIFLKEGETHYCQERRLNERKKRKFLETLTRPLSGSSDESNDLENAMAECSFLREFDDEDDMEEVGR
ncbi:unnamed protein product, partial [Mesorhabditis belari]|uniref:Uncharacterized protein n=1 Tax=Mesorhabditis belari TaxID=2138241 RepID=A0AAF3FH75_9BILA